MRVAVIDIGKPGKNLGWAMDKPDDGGENIDECVEAIGAALDGEAVALGFEAPQFVPMRHDPMRLTAGRKGESGIRPANTNVLRQRWRNRARHIVGRSTLCP